jgi:hypothetical protein
MRFTLSHLAEDPGGHKSPFLLMVERGDFLELYESAPSLCHTEFSALVHMYGHFFGAESSWPEAEIDDAANLLRIEKDCRSLVLSIQPGLAGRARVVYDAE